MKIEKKQISTELSANTRLLITALKRLEPGDEVRWPELTRAVGRDVRSDARSALESARRVLLRDEKIRFGVVRGVGLRRMTDLEVATSGDAALRSISRKANREKKKIEAVQRPEDLPAGAMTQMHTHAALLGTLAYVTRPKEVQRLESVCAANNGIDQSAVLRVFGVTGS